MLKETLLENGLAYVKNSGLPLEKYESLLPEINVYRQLFRFKYTEKVEDAAVLKKLLHLNDLNKLAKYSDNLDSWLASAMGGSIRLDWLSYVCPECLNAVVQDKAEEGDKVCLACGLVADASYEESLPFDDSLDRDVTFQPTSKLDFRDGLGNTLKSQQIHHLLINTDDDFSTFKELQPQLASGLSLFGLVAKDGFCYRLLNGYVRHVPIGDVDNVFNQKDKPLRKCKLAQVVDSFTTENKPILNYAEQLCNKYGIEDKTFKGALGLKIRKARSTLKSLGNSRPRLRPIADTIFFVCLLDFKKRHELMQAKPYLMIDANIFNLLCDYRLFKLRHAKPNYDRALLYAYEKQALESAKSAV